MEQFHCPFAVTKPQIKILICKLSLQNGTDYTKLENAMPVACAYQRYCNCQHGVVNSAGAKECYDNQVAKTTDYKERK